MTVKVDRQSLALQPLIRRKAFARISNLEPPLPTKAFQEGVGFDNEEVMHRGKATVRMSKLPGSTSSVVKLLGETMPPILVVFRVEGKTTEKEKGAGC